MSTNQPFLPAEIEAAVAQQHGGPISIAGQHGRYVVMNVDIYAAGMNATPDELADSVASIKRSLAQAAAGQTRDLDEVFDELDSRYGS
jgi:PHD/YefM family antitoxin component YafN of YafNO toxin-antitoxin module